MNPSRSQAVPIRAIALAALMCAVIALSGRWAHGRRAGHAWGVEGPSGEPVQHGPV